MSNTDRINDALRTVLSWERKKTELIESKRDLERKITEADSAVQYWEGQYRELMRKEVAENE